MKEASYDKDPNPDILPAYWRTDLNISKNFYDDKLEIGLTIRNLFNRRNYIASVWGAHKGLEEFGIGCLLRINYKLY
jgi:outer membrane receptor for monomeric catechols